ncbi:M48 family metallopeptidase [Treponema sp.]|uniref:M48 family metallopeptidase n=1 Tax=Treponema sp. TaxID=166 RepID=UPI003FD81DFE
MLDYRLIQSNRKTIQIHILPDKTVEVRAPKNVSEKRIHTFVCSKENWINNKINEKKIIAQIPVNHFYVPGETFYFRGKQYTLKTDVAYVKKSFVTISGNNLLIQTRLKNPETFQNVFMKWQRDEAKKVFAELFDECWNNFIKFYPNYEKPVLALRTMKSRWGSLTQNSNTQYSRMTLNTLLICSNNNCIKQVIYHELCHLVHPNHEKNFYETFEFFVSDWKDLKKELEDLFVCK